MSMFIIFPKDRWSINDRPGNGNILPLNNIVKVVFNISLLKQKAFGLIQRGYVANLSYSKDSTHQGLCINHREPLRNTYNIFTVFSGGQTTGIISDSSIGFDACSTYISTYPRELGDEPLHPYLPSLITLICLSHS